MIADRFKETCDARLGRPAILQLTGGRTLTFGDLWSQYELTRDRLRRIGAGPDACVLALIGNRVEFISLFVACLELGASLVPVGEATDTEAQAFAASAGATFVVTNRALPWRAAEALELSPEVRVLRLTDSLERPGHGRSMVLRLTSGSSAMPKATLATEHNLISDGEQIIQGMGIQPDDVNLGAIPLSHSYAMGNLIMPLVLQGTALALRGSFGQSQFLPDLVASRATVFPGVPFMFEHVRQTLGQAQLPSSLRLMLSAGARLDPETVRWFHAHTGRKIHSFYGTSETGGITYDASDDVADPLDVGRPLPGVTVTLVDHEGVQSRVFVRSPAVAGGYAETETNSETSGFRDGGFLTGDLGYFTGDGRLVLTGRVSALVNVAGRKVDPAEVDRVLLTIDGVRDARTLGVASDTRGEELIAFVVRATDSLTPIELRRRCAAVLSPYKIPRRFVFLEQLPVDARGKTDRRRLEALAAE